jgi:hypothetical protein
MNKIEGEKMQEETHGKTENPMFNEPKNNENFERITTGYDQHASLLE